MSTVGRTEDEKLWRSGRITCSDQVVEPQLAEVVADMSVELLEDGVLGRVGGEVRYEGAAWLSTMLLLSLTSKSLNSSLLP